jgi:hypothetical protein
MLESCRIEIARHMSVTREGLGALQSSEEMRLTHLRSLSDKSLKTEKDLRSWLNAMNLRVRVHYLYLPTVLFVIAAGWSVVALAWPLIKRIA